MVWRGWRYSCLERMQVQVGWFGVELCTQEGLEGLGGGRQGWFGAELCTLEGLRGRPRGGLERINGIVSCVDCLVS